MRKSDRTAGLHGCFHARWCRRLGAVLVLLCLSAFVCNKAQPVTPAGHNAGPTCGGQAFQHVVFLDKGNHYEATLDFTSASHRQVGFEYGQKLAAIPKFEELMDSYLNELTDQDWFTYKTLLERAARLKANLPRQYAEEIEGMAAGFGAAPLSFAGDGKLSLDEIYLLNLLPDVARETQCTALAVFGPRSATGGTIVGRNLDWPDGQNHQVSRFQAITTYKEIGQTIVSVGCLGFQGIMSGFNKDGVFAAILDSPSGEPFSLQHNRSYTMDLRQALEKCSDLKGVARFMSDPGKRFCFNHLIFIADPAGAGVLENNFSGPGNNIHRALRTADSRLNAGITWAIPNAVAATNSFLLQGNYDNFNHCHKQNMSRARQDCRPARQPERGTTARWDNLKTQLLAAGPVQTVQAIERILSFHNGNSAGPVETGDIFNTDTMQSMVFEPATKKLQIYFRPKDGLLPAKPAFEKIELTAGTR